MKVVINICYGGFSVSKAVYKELDIEWDGYGFDFDLLRSDTALISAIEKVGLIPAAGTSANLKIVDIPDDVKWFIENYDGIESIHEEHKIWE